MTRALILAGGGITGIAWESGVLAGLAAGGVDTQTWDLGAGTSAGAYVGARLTGDGSPGPLYAIQTSGNDAYEESELRVLFGPDFVRTLRLSRHPLLRWVRAVWLANFVALTVMRHGRRTRGRRATRTRHRTTGRSSRTTCRWAACGHRVSRTGRPGAAAEGVDTALWLAAAPDARAWTGRLFLDRRPRPIDRVPMTRLSAADRRTLWDQVVAMTGESDPIVPH